MNTDDPRIKRVLKRYLKGERFLDASLELTGIHLTELEAAFRCSSGDDLTAPRELDEFAVNWLSMRMQMNFEIEVYDYFLHSYVRREFCSEERIPPKGLKLPCEDGPPKRIPLEKGLKWVSVRTKNSGEETYVAIEE